MVPDISRGTRTYGLLAYLYGPGKRDEHTDPHQVASWDGFAPDPGRDPDATLSQLAQVLDLRVDQLGDRAPKEHVWHCSVRNDPGDRYLTDTEWGEVARRIVHATNIAPAGDPDGCRWVAVRHADDHIHILATTVRADLRQARSSYDWPRSQAECRRIEKEWGLRELKAGDGTAAQNPTSAERFKAERTGHDRTPREMLRETVRRAVAGARDEAEFFTRLTEAGVLVNQRIAPSGDTLGYTVAIPGDHNRDGKPIWFSGSKLAPDLSLPRIRQRLAGSPLGPDQGSDDERRHARPGTAGVRRSLPAQARRQAAREAERATTFLAEDDDEGAAAQLVGIGELLDATAQTSAAHTRQELREAARAFERATRSHIRAERADNRAVRAAARGIIQAGGALGRGEDGGATAMLLSTLVLVAVAAARWHSARGHAQQAAASQQAAAHLRVAYRAAAQTPMRAMRDQGRILPQPVRQRHADTIGTALPEHNGRLNGEPGWDALTATLDQAERAGRDPAALLKEAVEWRELDTADNITDVLVWRLRLLGKLPATADTSRTSIKASGKTKPKKTSSPQQHTTIPPRAVESPAHPAPADSRPRGPRR
jgi:hypothetical protein